MAGTVAGAGGTGAATAAAASDATWRACANAASTAPWVLAGMAATPAIPAPAEAWAVAGTIIVLTRSATRDANQRRCPINFRKFRSAMISFLALYVSNIRRSDPKKAPKCALSLRYL
ncbi:MAG TPA: hypothetical protein VMA77_12345 [Solirubrobacteraceae bacterium]|nr:hypothetical protein [Solirubrobacteraceae bacterium]